MEKFFDNDVQLTFIGFNKDDIKNEDYINLYKQYVEQLNIWTDDEGIQKYIGNDMKLGDFFACITEHSTHVHSKSIHKHYLMFDKDLLVGSALLTINDHKLKEYVTDDEKYDNFRQDEDPILYIEYLATNPQVRNKGYGARIVKGITNNKQIITENNICGVAATINNSNESSKKAFLKSNFICTPAKSFNNIDKDFRVYYFGKHKKAFEKDI